MEKIRCPYCGLDNFAESEICWTCYKALRPSDVKPPASQEPSAPSAEPAEGPAGAPWTALGGLALASGLALFYAQWWRVENYFSPLDYINLAFHEAGHIFLGFSGEFIMTAGGSFFQLLLPALCGYHLWRQGSRLGWQLCLFWFGENLLNISVYAGDAIAQALPLAGGGVHDWTYLLATTGLIAHTRGAASVIFAAGSAIVFCSLFCLVRDSLARLVSGGRQEPKR